MPQVWGSTNIRSGREGFTKWLSRGQCPVSMAGTWPDETRPCAPSYIHVAGELTGLQAESGGQTGTGAKVEP